MNPVCAAPARATALFLIIALSATANASASFTIVTDMRSISVAVAASNPLSNETFGPDVRTRPGLGLNWTTNNSVLGVRSVIGAGASSAANQTSTFGAGGVITLQGTCSASAQTEGIGLAASANAASNVDLVFDVSAGTRVRIQSSQSGNAIVRLTDEQNTQVFFDGSGFFDQTFGASRLRFVASTAASVNIGPTNSASDGGAFSVTLTIPAPATATLLAPLALLPRRRR